MAAVKQWIDGYDTGIWYADLWVGKLLSALEGVGILQDTVIVVSADHSESQGEFDIWGDHQTADHSVCRVPLLIRWPGITDGGRVETALHYHFDWAATLIELVGGQVPSNWDGVSFAEAFRANREVGRDYLITSQGAWSVQRGVRFDWEGAAYMCLTRYQLPAYLQRLRATGRAHHAERLARLHPDEVEPG